MLARSFLPAAQLGHTEAELDALIKVLGMLERGELTHVPIHNPDFVTIPTFTGHFNMSLINVVTDCGTACCILGTAELVSGVKFKLRQGAIFFPDIEMDGGWDGITPAQAAHALSNYLTTGRPNWAEALA